MNQSPIERLMDADRNRRVRIAVLGDSMLDAYVTGTVQRVSPEGPHLVLAIPPNDVRTVPGGAANVARQLQPWNVDVVFLSMLGHGSDIWLSQYWGLDVTFCVRMTGAMPFKRRFVAEDGRTLLRVDEEVVNFGEPKIKEKRAELLAQLTRIGESGIDALVVADYHKGALDSFLIGQAPSLSQCPTIVDPKRRPVQWCKDATVLKCNEREINDYRMHQGTTIITRGALSPEIVGYPKLLDSQEVKPVGSLVRPVSVAGAGDHFAAILALAMAHGFELPEAAQLAHESGCVYVTRPYNEPVLPHELESRYHPGPSKVQDVQYVKKALDWRKPNPVVFTNGCFDLLGDQHVYLLETARNRGQILVVGVNSDDSVRRLKGPRRPVVPLDQRLIMLAALPCVDFLIPFDEDTPEEILKVLRPNVRVKGDFPDLNCAGDQYAGEVLLIPPLPSRSTSETVRSIRNGDAG